MGATIRLDKYKAVALFCAIAAWVLYMAALGTPWYEVIRDRREGPDCGACVNMKLRLYQQHVDSKMTDVFGHSQSRDISYDSLKLDQTHTIITAAYAFAILSFAIMTLLVFLLLANIFDSGGAMVSVISKLLIVLLILFNTLAILIFAGINNGFEDDEKDTLRDYGPAFVFYPCTGTCTDSFRGSKNYPGYTAKWHPGPGWDMMVAAWPMMLIASLVLLLNVDLKDPSQPSHPVSIEMSL